MYSSVVSLIWKQIFLKECASVMTQTSGHMINRKFLKMAPACYHTYSLNRQFHFNTRLKQKKTLPDISNAKAEQPDKDVSLHEENTSAQNPDSEDIDIAIRVRRPTPIPEREREYGDTSVPPHDDSRLTPTGRKLERKAWKIFDDVAAERGFTQEAFKYAVQKYVKSEHLYRRGALEFIYVGLDEMKRFGLSRELSCYKELMKAFPEKKFVPTNAVQEAFEHYPRQQQCTIDLLEQMGANGVIPDDEFGIILKKRFGSKTSAARRYRRMMYWMPKFKNMNPWPIPRDLPDCQIELALMALKRMCGFVDRDYKYTVWQTQEEELDTVESTFIASAQSPVQKELLKKHDSQSPLSIEGPYTVWLRMKMVNYFVLRAEPNVNALAEQKRRDKEAQDDENLCNWTNFWEDEDQSSSLRPVLTVHEQDDCTVLGVAVTGSSSKESLLSWVRLLQRDNPKLGDTPVLFKIFSSVKDLEVVRDNEGFKDRDGQAS